MNTEHPHPLHAAVLKLLRPLVRLLLKNGVSHGTFSEIAKWVYVDVAHREFAIKGRKQSTSRVSVITGLSRKEVARVRKIPPPDNRSRTERYNRASRVIAAWRCNDEFLDENHNPALLPITGPSRSFSRLVKQFSGDMPVRAILDELIRVGAVEKLDDGTVGLLTRAYVPAGSESDKLRILGTDTAQLISTIDHNLDPGSSGPFFQRKVEYDNLPDEALEKLRALSADRAQTLLEKLDQWLRKHDRDANQMLKGTGRNRAGVGIYYFEEPYRVEEN